jgi:hypothetical protein
VAGRNDRSGGLKYNLLFIRKGTPYERI